MDVLESHRVHALDARHSRLFSVKTATTGTLPGNTSPMSFPVGSWCMFIPKSQPHIIKTAPPSITSTTCCYMSPPSPFFNLSPHYRLPMLRITMWTDLCNQYVSKATHQGWASSLSITAGTALVTAALLHSPAHGHAHPGHRCQVLVLGAFPLKFQGESHG